MRFFLFGGAYLYIFRRRCLQLKLLSDKADGNTSTMPKHLEHSSSDPEANAPDDSLKGSSAGEEGDANIDVQGFSSQADDVLADEKAVRRLVRKIDWRLLPCLALTYSFALIDRVNLPNARIAGMDEDLGLSVGDRYSIVSMIFFVPYVVFQFPSNIVIRKIGAMWWLPSIVMAWGVVMIGMGFSKEWTDLLAMRVLLGVCEVSCFWIRSVWLTVT